VRSNLRNAERGNLPGIEKSRYVYGLSALILILAAIVTLGAIGQPWVAAGVVTTVLVRVVAIFVTGEYDPAPVNTAPPVETQPAWTPQEDLPGAVP
jgi:hypothetical protein